MKTLYLIRHAKSSWKNSDLIADILRPLNKRGERDAPIMGQLLHEKGVMPSMLLSSPAQRTQSTALEIAKAIGYPIENIRIQENLYEAACDDILRLVQAFEEDWSSVMLFGHNPTFTDFSNLFGKKNIENVPTCGIVCILFEVSTWAAATPETGQIRWFEYPKKINSK